VVQPTIFAAMTAERPTAPAPKIAILDPAFGASELMTAPAPVWMPQPSGPISSSGTSLRIFTTLRSDAIAFSAKEDWQKKQPEIDPSFELSGDVPSTRAPLRLRA